MTIERAIRNGYTEIYHTFSDGVDFEQTNGIVRVKCLIRYELHEGHKLWRVFDVCARYAPQTYYVIASTTDDAIKKFQRLFPRVQVAGLGTLTDEQTASVLANPAKYIVF